MPRPYGSSSCGVSTSPRGRCTELRAIWGNRNGRRSPSRELFEIAFRGHLIDRPDHEVIRELAGEL